MRRLVAASPNEGDETMPNRVIFLADFDYFFAQCEELRNPAIKDKPVVVGVYSGRTEESGAVSTSNYVARKYGVKSGLPLFLAKRKLEGTDAVFFKVDHAYYEQISDRIMAIFRGYASTIEQVSVDEAYLDVTEQVEGSYEKARDYALKIKADVKAQVGISFTIGVGPNKVIAKIACDSQKPDGLTIVHPQEAQAFLAPLPVDRLLGVGHKISARLESTGVKTIGDLAQVDCQRLVEMFGKALGIYFYNAARGIDEEPVVEAGESESIGRMGTLKENTRDIAIIMEKIDSQVEEIYIESTGKKLSYRLVGISAVMIDLSGKSRSKTLEKAAKDKETIRVIARELFEKYLAETQLPIRRVGVRIGSFVKEEKSQKQLTSFFQSG
jgi:DNA polymerase IV (DinB-like DNA polymerase)